MKSTRNERAAVGIPPWLPDERAEEIDLSELAPLSPAITEACTELGLVLDAHVAAYRATALGRPAGLCSIFQTVDLAQPLIDHVIATERRFPGVVFVAYRKPLSRHATTHRTAPIGAKER